MNVRHNVIFHHLKGVTLLDPALSLLKVGMASIFDPLRVCPKLDVVPLDFAVPVFDSEFVQIVLDPSLPLGMAELMREN